MNKDPFIDDNNGGINSSYDNTESWKDYDTTSLTKYAVVRLGSTTASGKNEIHATFTYKANAIQYIRHTGPGMRKFLHIIPINETTKDV